MTKEIINKSELKTIRFLLQSGQKLAISTKKFERVLDKIDSLEQENKQMKSALKEIRKMVDCKRCKYINCNVSQCAKIETKVNEVLND